MFISIKECSVQPGTSSPTRSAPSRSSNDKSIKGKLFFMYNFLKGHKIARTPNISAPFDMSKTQNSLLRSEQVILMGGFKSAMV